MLRLRNHCRLSTRMRDRLGILCAVGAVACLGSLTVHWSQPYPVRRSNWEQELFSDLVDSGGAQSSPDPVANELVPPVTSARLTQPIATGDVEPIVGFEHRTALAPDDLPIPLPQSSLLATPINQRPVSQRPRFILPVRHEASPADSIRSDTEFETPTEQPSSAADEPVTLFFLPFDDN